MNNKIEVLFNKGNKTNREREREREHAKYNYLNYSVDVSSFLLELRTNILNKTINEFIFDMGWPNEKYYSKIVNGYYDLNKNKKYSRPTIDYIFGGINHAMANHKEWWNKKDEIYNLLKKYFFSWSNYI